MAKIGKYELIRLLATGGMAEVYLAKTGGALGFEKTVVVKKIRSHLMGDPQFLQMFLNEAKIAAQLNHPNIVQVFDFGEAEDEVYYLAMEYIDGPNLRTLSAAAHKAGKPISLPLCAKIVSSTCEGLAYAHEFVNPETQQPLNIVHRDLSPDNVVIAKNGAVKVVDFGIAKAAEQLFQTQSGLRKGKLAYMSPEYLKGAQPDRRSDVFALGVVLYELLSNKKPYDAENEITLMHAMIYEPMVPVRTRRPDVPEDLEEIVNKALARDPGERYQSCRELQEELEQFVINHGEPLSAIHISRAIAGLQPELEAAALAKTPNRVKSPAVAGTPPLAHKTPAKKSTGSSGEKRIPTEGKRSASGEKRSPSEERRSPSGEKRAGATPSRPVSVPPAEEVERTIRMTGAELAAKAAELQAAASVEQGLAGLRKDFSEKEAAYGEGDSSARTLTMPAVKEPVIATPVRYPPAKPHSDRTKTEPAMPKVEREPAGKAQSKAPASAEPTADLLKVVRQHGLTLAAVALALLLIGGGIAVLVLKRPSPPPEPVTPPVVVAPPPPVPITPPPPPPTPEVVTTPAKTEPPPPPAGGPLEVTSNVPAWVKVDGRRLCRSMPCRSGVRPGKHEVELVDPATGFWMKRWKEVEFKVGTPVKLDGQVTKGTLKVSSPATGDAAVYVDQDKQPRVAPLKFELNEGLHHIRFETPKKPAGYEQDVVVEPGKEIPVTAKYL